MGSSRKCSYCGGTGHDKRNCPVRRADEPAENGLWVFISNLSNSQSNNILRDIMSSKSKHAPSAQAAFARGSMKSLPQRISKLLGRGEDD